MTFGEKIRHCRLIKKMTQTELAEKIGAGINSICLYENEKREPSFFTVSCIARALDVSLDYLAGFEKPPVNVIFCKDCKYYYEQNQYIHTCKKNMCKLLRPDGFCDDAEEREK